MDKDLKDTIRKLEEAKRRQERLEKTIIILSGILIIIVFTVIGINIYSGKEEKVSQPEINIVSDKTPEVAKVVETEKKNEPVKQEKKEEKTKPEKPKQEKQLAKAKQNTQQQKKQPVPNVLKPKKEQKQKVEKKIVKKVESKPVKKVEKPKVVKKHNKVIATTQKGFYYIQVGAFSSKENAEKAKKHYKLPSSRFYIIRTGKLYKLLIGKFKTRKEAQMFMRKHGIKGLVKKV